MNLAFTVTDSYVDYMATTLMSLLEKTAQPVVAYVLTSDVSAYSRHKLQVLEQAFPQLTVEVIVVEEAAFEGLPLNRDHISRLEVYFRMAFASLLPESVERVLYLDSDLLVQQDLTELWETDLTGYYMAGVSEPPSEGAFAYRRSIGMTNPEYYVNSGVLLMDLVKIRQDQVQTLLFETGERIKDKILLQDQDIINVALEGKVKLLPVTYNYGYMEREAGLLPEAEVAIMHHSLEKPWLENRDVIVYNRRAVDAYRRKQGAYRRLIEPLVTVLVTISGSSELLKTLESIDCQIYQHLDVVLIDQSGDDHLRRQAVDWAFSHANCRYYRIDPGACPVIEGLKLALGDLITWVSSGHVIDASYLSSLYLDLVQSSADLALTSPSFYDSSTGIYRFYRPLFLEGQEALGQELLELLLAEPMEVHQHYLTGRGLLWRKELLHRHLRCLPAQTSQLLRLFLPVDARLVQAREKLYLVTI